jgi:hypothetical protein
VVKFGQRHDERADTVLSFPGVERVLAELEQVDRKERKDVSSRLDVLGAMAEMLGPGEALIWLQSALLNNSTEGLIDPSAMFSGMLVVTDRQVLFASKGVGKRASGYSGRWELHEVSAVALAPNGYARKVHEIRVETSTGKLTFVVTHMDAAQVTVERLRQGIAHAVKPSMAAGANGQSDAEELARWAQLRDQGVISDAEFAVQKAKLLS